MTGSWVIRSRATGLVLFETWDARIFKQLNRARYEAVPIGRYLGELNARIRQQMEADHADR